MKRLEERKFDLENAFQRLKEALQENETQLAIDGTLHRFEFTFELAWKTMKDYLEYKCHVHRESLCTLPRASMRQQGLLVSLALPGSRFCGRGGTAC